jgi:hypothetical protein|tara:strand:- start:281 stop:1243 length:963 start_codon:yes stop_codon:yes gene_type:complete
MIFNPYAYSFGQTMANPQQQAASQLSTPVTPYQIPANPALLLQQVGMQPVLTNPTVAPATVNTNVPPRRDAVAMAVPRPRVPLSEKLMRVGGAIVGGAQEGGLAAFEAGTNELGEIMDQQRQLDLLYGRDVNARIAASAAAQQEILEDNRDAIEQFTIVNDKFNEALRHLDPKGDGSDAGITGFWDATIGKLQYQLTGDPRRAGQLLMSELKVDDALLRTANTKGAISDSEMRLFLEPAPSSMDDEENWKDWIRRKQKANQIVLYRLRNGIDLRKIGGITPTPQQLQAFNQQYGLSATAPAPTQTGQSTKINGVTVTKVK